MSKKDGVVIASRVLSVLLTIWALSEVSFLPEFVHSYLHYTMREAPVSPYIQYMQHYYLLRLAFLITRIIGYLLMARWLYKGPDIEELLLPEFEAEPSVRS